MGYEANVAQLGRQLLLFVGDTVTKTKTPVLSDNIQNENVFYKICWNYYSQFIERNITHLIRSGMEENFCSGLNQNCP